MSNLASHTSRQACRCVVCQRRREQRERRETAENSEVQLQNLANPIGGFGHTLSVHLRVCAACLGLYFLFWCPRCASRAVEGWQSESSAATTVSPRGETHTPLSVDCLLRSRQRSILPPAPSLYRDEADLAAKKRRAPRDNPLRRGEPTTCSTPWGMWIPFSKSSSRVSSLDRAPLAAARVAKKKQRRWRWRRAEEKRETGTMR